MSVVKIRLARGGCKKRPYYKIVVANSTSPRDGKFIEKIGFYNPLLPNDHADYCKIKSDRVQYWFDHGAWPTDRVYNFITKFAAQVAVPDHIAKKNELKVRSRKPRAPKKK